MAKDPRFNFYPDNWTGGTSRMTFEQKGAYIDLLVLCFHCLMDKLPGFTEDEAKAILARNPALWNDLKSKFVEAGKYFFSARLKRETEKAMKHSEHQSETAKLRWKREKNRKLYAETDAENDAFNGIGYGNGNSNEGRGGPGEKEWAGDMRGIEQLRIEFLADGERVTLASKSLGIPPDTIPRHMDVFIDHLKLQKEALKTEGDFANHFVNFTRKKIQSNGTTTTASTRRTASSAVIQPKTDFGW